MENQYPEPQNIGCEMTAFIDNKRVDPTSRPSSLLLASPLAMEPVIPSGSSTFSHQFELANNIRKMISHIGDDPSREGVQDTPKRVIKSWKHLFSGYQFDPVEVLKTQFTEKGSEGIVLCKRIEMYSTCEHHLLPFFGHATVGYIPSAGRIVGVSKLARLVEGYSRRLQNQERITRLVADALNAALNPLAVGVLISAEHFCMRARGVEKQGATMVTSCYLGSFKTDKDARNEFLRLAGE